MILFWVIAGVLTLGALAWVLTPLWRGRPGASPADRDAANARLYREELADLDREFAQGRIDERQLNDAKLEVERRLIEDVSAGGAAAAAVAANRAPARKLALGLGVLVPVAAVLLYLYVGDPAAVDPRTRLAQSNAAHSVTPEQINEMVATLAKRLQSRPDDVQGWTMLARSYSVLGRFAEASKAYAHVVGLEKDNPDLLADYADALAMAQGRTLKGEPYDVVKRALKINPRHVKALALAGSAEFEAGRFAKAARYWEQSLAQLPADSPFAKSLRASVDEARSRAGEAPLASAPAERPASANAAAAISGTVRLSPRLANRVSPDQTLFVYAHAEGARMPVAIVRARASELPYAFRLDDSMSMTPSNPLSAQSKVRVEARISKSGSAMPQSGDLRGESALIAPGASGLDLVIDQIVK